MNNRPVVYNYIDYRSFLKDMFAFRKQKNKNFSHRYFARKAGFASSNFLNLVLKGERNLSQKSVVKVAKGFELNKQEHKFFENMVFMNQAKSNDEKNYYYQEMMSVNSPKINKINKSSYEYFSKWYYPVIREAATFGKGKYTASQIAGMLDPKITPKQAEKALNALLELGLLEKNSNGQWEKCDNIVDTGPEVSSLSVANFHKEMLEKASESIERHPPDKRHISGMVLSIKADAKTVNEIKKRINRYSEELLELSCRNVRDANQVYYVHMQVFPLADESKEEA